MMGPLGRILGRDFSSRPRGRVCCVLVLYGMPREMTMEVLAHEMMHAHFRLHGFPPLSGRVEEGLCQLIAFLWLTRDADRDRTAGRNHSRNNQNTGSDHNEDIAALKRFCLHKLERDPDPDYGEGFREAYAAYLQHGLVKTLETVHTTGNLPPMQ